ncbi:MAG: ChbG/HpnK family deacetylase [Desulfohalobiaceae bacterium]|nr:ChbG/HpnK family deacetylase [Desulfohalobiaceae bacterium]
MAGLILHSDDLGLHPAVNQAIYAAAAAGSLTSASLLVNAPATQAALDGLPRKRRLGIGLHLNILRGRPLSDPELIPTLLDGQGRFCNSISTLLRRSLLKHIKPEHVYTEYRQQLIFMLDHGLRPTHLDGEKHTHLLLPEAVEAVNRLGHEFGISKVRTIQERGLLRDLRRQGESIPWSPAQWCKLQLLEYRSEQARKQWRMFKTPQAFFGVLSSGKMDTSVCRPILRRLLQQARSWTLEWMFHLSYPFEDDVAALEEHFGSFFLTGARSRETQFLLAADTIRLLQDNRQYICNYQDLKA